MKVFSFKQFLEEEDTKAIVKTGVNSKSLDNNVTKEMLNAQLAKTTGHPFITPYIALGAIARVLAYANIILPQYVFLDRKEGEVVFDATQFGKMAGVNLDGSPANNDTEYFVYFSYSMNDDGYYDCFAVLADQDELDKILDTNDEDVDEVDVSQKMNEEKDYFAGVRPSLYVFKHTDEKGTKHFLSFHKNGDITYHNKTSDGRVGNSHPEMKPLYAKSSKDHMQNALYDFARHVAKEKVTGVRHALARSARKVNEELKGNQHKLDVAEPKGKLTSADFKKLRGEEAVDEGVDKKINKQKKNKAIADIIKNKIHKSLLPSLKYGRRELKKEEPIDDMSTEIKKLRGEEAVDEGVDKKINKQKKNKAIADIIKNKIHK